LTLWGLKKADFDPPWRVDGDKTSAGVLFLLQFCLLMVAWIDLSDVVPVVIQAGYTGVGTADASASVPASGTVTAVLCQHSAVGVLR